MTIAEFLGVKLTDEELSRVVHRSSYQYMKENEFVFEMSPPTPFNTGTGSFFVKGTGDRGKDLSDNDTRRVYEFCRKNWQPLPILSAGITLTSLGIDRSQS